MAIRWLLPAIFFASGASALVFETLWFRQAGLSLGNGIWASSLVLSAFMAGLGLGNGIAIRLGDRLKRPLRVYALLEVGIAISGVGLVFGLPKLGPLLAPALGPILDQPVAANAIRFGVAFAFLLVPSAAMGITLPILTRTLTRSSGSFAGALGLLYGVNTLGAVTGPLLTETVLIHAFGIRGSALAAGAANLGIALAALLLDGAVSSAAPAPVPAATGRTSVVGRDSLRWLVAAFGSGFALLALELLWFRVLLLFLPGSALAFALMLSTVLAGIGLGGLVASWWLDRRPEGWREAAALAFSAAAAAAICYAAFPFVVAPFGTRALTGIGEIALVTAALALPTALLSGALFTATGAAIRERMSGDAAAVGALTLFNTIGAAVGPLFSGFVLLPLLGTQRAILATTLLYAGIGVVLLGATRRHVVTTATFIGAIAGIVWLATSPVQQRFLDVAAERWSAGIARVVAAREGLTETVIYLQYQRSGLPRHHLMVTNSFAMSGTEWPARRYMKLFVLWPAAVHRNLQKALLISYGVGSTARALADVPSLDQIDVVDISRDVLALSDVVYPDPETHPLRDPRVHVHIEDGRHFLQVRPERYDLITSEPPPPHVAGVVNLYTQEYFALMRERLAEGGIVTYWLPTHSLDPLQSQAILRAFCLVFEDCSLWAGAGYDLMMVGSRGLGGPVSEAEFTRPWRNPAIAPELHAIGFDGPETLGATFIGDAAYLDEVTAGVAPLVDDHPERLWKASATSGRLPKLYRQWMDVEANRRRFLASPLIARLWPAALRGGTLRAFDLQGVINRMIYRIDPKKRSPLETAHFALERFPDSAAALWALDSDVEMQRALANGTPAGAPGDLLLQRGIGLLVGGRFDEALATLDSVPSESGLDARAALLSAYSLCRLGRVEEANARIDAGARRPQWSQEDASGAGWLAARCATLAANEASIRDTRSDASQDGTTMTIP